VNKVKIKARQGSRPGMARLGRARQGKARQGSRHGYISLSQLSSYRYVCQVMQRQGSKVR